MNAPATPLHVDRRASIVVEPFVFRRDAWAREGTHVFPGPPGTWCDVRPKKGAPRAPKGVLALYRCPACLAVKALHKAVHRIAPDGKVTPDLVCGGDCGFHRAVYLDRYSDKPLYAVAIECETAPGVWTPEMHYCHAKDEAEARFHLGHLGGHYRIVAAAPAIGFFVEDRAGNVTAD